MHFFLDALRVRSTSVSVPLYASSRLVGALFDCVDALRPSQQYFSHVGTISCLSALNQYYITLNAPITTIVVCFSRLLKEASITNSVDPDRTAPIGAVCSGSTLFASICDSSVIMDSYLQQTTPADNIFRCIFFLVL